MYTMLGADGRGYGPVDATRMVEWIGQGRANRHTRVRVDEGPWLPLGNLPEFAEALGQVDSRRPPPPLREAEIPGGEGSGQAAELAGLALATARPFFVGRCFSRGWELVRSRFWLLVGGTILMWLLVVGVGSLPVVGVAAPVLLGFVMWGGLEWLFLRTLRGQAPDVGTAFVGFGGAFVPLMLAGLVASVLTSLGYMLCVLPGIYLTVAWGLFVPLLILDKGLDFWAAMECSRRVVTRHWWRCFGLVLLAWLVASLGVLACGVGFFLGAAWGTGAVACAYEDLFGGMELGRSTEPAPAPLPVVAEVKPPSADEPPAAPTAGGGLTGGS